jgi:type I restriction enzyme R subunit
MSDYKTIAESNNFIVLDKYTQEWQVSRRLPERIRSGA